MPIENAIYAFLPFLIQSPSDFPSLVKHLESNPSWTPENGKTGYLLKYIADKFDRNSDRCLCYHYVLADEQRSRYGIPAVGETVTTAEHEDIKKNKVRFSFSVSRVHLFCFSTSLCILAFQLSAADNDPLHIAALEFYIKKVKKEKLYPQSLHRGHTTLFAMAAAIAAEIPYFLSDSFFYYAPKGSARANMLTIVDVPLQDDYSRELYYLRNCYHDGYLFMPDPPGTLPYVASNPDVLWGVSSEAAVCLTCAEMGRRKFLEGTFYKNFHRYYLLMFVMLLHQKYVLYLFLTRVSADENMTLEELEDYRSQLYAFETDFVFSRVTEVPQYEKPYERIFEEFALKDMYKDVHEPLIQLSEVRRAEEQKQRAKEQEQQEQHEHTLSRSLIYLSILSVFSALVDSFDFASSYISSYISESIVGVAHAVSLIFIIVVAFFVIKNLRNRPKSK